MKFVVNDSNYFPGNATPYSDGCILTARDNNFSRYVDASYLGFELLFIGLFCNFKSSIDLQITHGGLIYSVH